MQASFFFSTQLPKPIDFLFRNNRFFFAKRKYLFQNRKYLFGNNRFLLGDNRSRACAYVYSGEYKNEVPPLTPHRLSLRVTGVVGDTIFSSITTIVLSCIAGIEELLQPCLF